MNKDKSKQLKADFPQIFTDLYDSTPQESCMSWGIECGDGWYDLIHKLCEDIMALNPPEEFKAAQVKEKFGGLRFYTAGSSIIDIAGLGSFKKTDDPPSINKLIDEAESESYNVCEACGSKEDVTSEGRWVATRCMKCRTPLED